MSRTSLDLWVGIFVLIGIGALFFLALRVGNVSSVDLSNAYVVRGQFDNIGGLKVRAPVKSAGVVVGRVDSINFDTDSYRAEVRMVVAADYEFPRDTIASVLTSGLLGEQYIGLDPGGDIEMLADGEKLQITQSAIVLEKLIGQFLFDRAQSPQE
ncbi:MAG: outer membrane lipid asymmetry maintenance protein MlaD [Azoarcus sp.]|nr:outer membrane lipid asymmetry maintenance protein MlaD [Azoarcus sp.]